MNYLLDTNVVSELRKIGDGKANARVAAWVDAEDAESFFISAITILELERGVLAIQRRDTAQGARLRAWLDNHVRPEFAGRILPGALWYVSLAFYAPAGPMWAIPDALIAATALVHGLTVATRNVRDFEGTGVVVVNPWEG